MLNFLNNIKFITIIPKWKKNTVIILGNQHLSVKLDHNLNHGINIKYKVKK